MKKVITLLLFLLVICTYSQAQEYYKSAVGLRLGYPASISYKTFISQDAALEAYLGLRGYGFGNFVNFSGAYQVHKPISGADGLQWYYGGGASVFFWNYDNDFRDRGFSTTALGVQGYLGLDYAFADAPINLTIDWIPTFFIGGSLNVNGFGGGFGNLGIRYIFSR